MTIPLKISPGVQNPHVLTFGQFQLFPSQRLLLKNGEHIELGSRALDVLIALVAHAGEVITTRDLVQRVWKGVVVDESCIRVHISALRKALSCPETSTSYVINVPGRGYSFVAPVTVPTDTENSAAMQSIPAGELPPRLVRMVGRDDTVKAISGLIKQHRFVTISGLGGMGKTTAAIAVAHHFRSQFEGMVIFLDLSAITDSSMLPGTLAAAVGVQYQEAEPLQTLVGLIRDMRLLVVFDSCDHVIDAVTCLAETLFGQAEQTHILVTSREPLRAEGEHIYRLGSLACPPEQAELKATDAMTFSAVQLFVERVAHNQGAYTLSDNDAPVVAHICRKLDGIALAIELGAGQVPAYGIQGIAELLKNRFSLFWEGRRNAMSRHQTLNAMIDWSYDLLSANEAMVLRRLSVLTGKFSLEVATQVVAPHGHEMMVIDAIGRLVTKSLVLAESNNCLMCYRLPYTTRAYALEKLHGAGEFDSTTERHAIYLVSLLERLNVQGEALPDYERIQRYIEYLGNICATLDWTFSESGNLSLGIRLAASSAPLFLGLSMLDECRRWSGRALAAGVCQPNGLPQETVWQEALAIATMFALGKPHSGNPANGISKVFDENLGDTLRQLRLLGGSSNTLAWSAEQQEFQPSTLQAMTLSDKITDPKGIAMMQWMLGDANQYAIKHESSGQDSRAGWNLYSSQSVGDEFSFSYDYRVRALSSLARISWLRGYPDQALQLARQALHRANHLRHPATICLALIYVSTVFLWTGDWSAARQTIDQLNSTAKLNFFEPELAVGLGLEGILLYSQGNVEEGVQQLHGCLSLLSVENHQVLATMFIRCLSEGFAATGRFDNALEIICGAMEMIENIGETFDTPEILRVAADLYAARPDPDYELAEQYLYRSLACAERQAALAWELRTATSLTRLHLKQGRITEAGKLLHTVFGKFSEGYDTLDMREARLLLESLSLRTTPCQ
ncbi:MULTISPECIES: winged helix-turn-helix domain-containing protein [Pseudomonas]|uniref:Winged helix-turn-helix domain-containing protein n=1 Tax=Pseudomonas gregormendelii TaxID=1628277 RepID=A0ABS3API8_9PSED|nr:winged helix-turn-helix domain-containing protein [Pseudomonas gregormendelii]MBN3968763.1 winged helix-turn-helix domain-containing protein [Pseudomonas gregormendelii]